MSGDIHRSSALVSVVIPCFNAAAHVRRSLASVLSQKDVRLEVIAVDDGSTDDTLEVLRSVDDVRLRVLSQPNRGVCAARNRALREARGDFVAFLDADDTWAEDCLHRLLVPLQEDAQACLSYCGWQNTGVEGPRARPFIPPDYERPDKVEVLLGGCRWPIHAALTRRQAILDAGGFDERFVTSEDYFLWLRVATKCKICRVPEALAFYHQHEGPRATADRVRVARNRIYVKREFLRQNPHIARHIGARRIRELVMGPTLQMAYEAYWDRDLKAARTLFHLVMRNGYGTLRDWKYMLPSLLPMPAHQGLIHLLERRRVSTA